VAREERRGKIAGKVRDEAVERVLSRSEKTKTDE
jgi:hypothetical protein